MVFAVPDIVIVPAFAVIAPEPEVVILPPIVMAAEVGMVKPAPLTARFPVMVTGIEGLNVTFVPLMVRLLKLNVPPPVTDLLVPLIVTVPVPPLSVPAFAIFPAAVSVNVEQVSEPDAMVKFPLTVALALNVPTVLIVR